MPPYKHRLFETSLTFDIIPYTCTFVSISGICGYKLNGTQWTLYDEALNRLPDLFEMNIFQSERQNQCSGTHSGRNNTQNLLRISVTRNDCISLRTSPWIRQLIRQTSEDRRRLVIYTRWEVLRKLLWEGVRPDGARNGETDGPAYGGYGSEDGKDCGSVLVRHDGHHSELG